MKSPKKRFRETFGRSSLYFEYFEIQKIQNIQNIFVLAKFFEFLNILKVKKIQNIFVLAIFFAYFDFFEIQIIQNIQKIMKSPKTRFRETFGRSSLYFEYFEIQKRTQYSKYFRFWLIFLNILFVFSRKKTKSKCIFFFAFFEFSEFKKL